MVPAHNVNMEAAMLEMLLTAVNLFLMTIQMRTVQTTVLTHWYLRSLRSDEKWEESFVYPVVQGRHLSRQQHHLLRLGNHLERRRAMRQPAITMWVMPSSQD